MANFCETCPEKGNCQGEIQRIRTLDIVTEGQISGDGHSASISFEKGIPQGPTDLTVAYGDAENGFSNPVTLHGRNAAEAETLARKYISKIEKCRAPGKARKFFGLVTKQVCAAPSSAEK